MIQPLSQTLLAGVILEGPLMCFRQKEKEHLVTVAGDPWEPIPFEGGMRDRPLKRKQTFKLPCDVNMLKPDEVRIYW
jgi:hypothetical protein